MALPSPSSRVSLRLRISLFDCTWAALSPLLALMIRDAPALAMESGDAAVLYCVLSFLSFLGCWYFFRINSQLPEHFSLHDAFDAAKAVVSAQLVTSGLVFLITRLDGIPRSTLVIQALVLSAGIVTIRLTARLSRGTAHQELPEVRGTPEHVVLVGANRLTSLYIRLLEAYRPHERRVVAVLDENESLRGRSIGGVPILGHPRELRALLKEFQVHGTSVSHVTVGGNADLLSFTTFEQLRRDCDEIGLDVSLLPAVLGLEPSSALDPSPAVDAPPSVARKFAVPRYFGLKRAVDCAVASTVLLLSFPILLVVGALTLIDVGFPVLFWQRRVGRQGRSFLLLKMRTLRAPFDRNGNLLSDAERLSAIGRLIRKTHLDELPQLINVIVGDMSLIGPRPLLPEDQPVDPGVRLMVRPGITGWAQVNGGTLLSASEKAELDEWYIRNASLSVDIRIVLMTARILWRGHQRSEQAFSKARAEHDFRRESFAHNAHQLFLELSDDPSLRADFVKKPRTHNTEFPEHNHRIH